MAKRRPHKPPKWVRVGAHEKGITKGIYVLVADDDTDGYTVGSTWINVTRVLAKLERRSRNEKPDHCGLGWQDV